MLNYVGENRKEYITEYGNVSAQSVGAILRSLIRLEDEGGKMFLGEPAFDFNDWLSCDEKGRGYINILHSVNLIHTPTIYSFFLLWLLSDLFEKLPEVGDCEKPKLVFFFDEAHLLFNEMPGALTERIVQVVKLIRSKGVGVYFISQSPGDIPDSVLAQLNNRVQHTLHAYTPAEQKAVHTAAFSFRANPAFNTEEVISQLGIGEALVSTLQEDGTPAIVERCKILPPQSFMGAITPEERQAVIDNSSIKGKYDVMVDNISAYEMILNPTVAIEENQEAEADNEEKATENSKDIWVCSCGKKNKNKFCTECGGVKPEKESKKETNKDVWLCECGKENSSKFCSECGKKQPESKSWKCVCGAKNKGKFCTECGFKKPQPTDEQWKCACGTLNMHNFCYNCGSRKPNVSGNNFNPNNNYNFTPINNYNMTQQFPNNTSQQNNRQQNNQQINKQVPVPKNNNANKNVKKESNKKEMTFGEKITRGLFGSRK